MKKKIIVFLLISLLFSITSNAQDLSFEEYNPKSTLVVPGKIVKRAKFPFIDVHGHQYRMASNIQDVLYYSVILILKVLVLKVGLEKR